MTELVDTITKKGVTGKNAKTLRDYDTYNRAQMYSDVTRYNQLLILCNFINKVNKTFKSVTRKDVEAYLASRNVKETSLNAEKIGLKMFYKWLNGGESYHTCVKWMKVSSAYNYKSPEDLLTGEEIKSLINACENERDRAIVSLLDDAAVRVGELVSLNIGSVKNDGLHLSINVVKSKTCKRSIGLITSAPIITQFLNNHPFRDKSDEPLFITYSSNCYGERMSDHSVYCMLQVLKERAGIKKKVTPHLFRHTVISRLSKLKINEAQLRIFSGWKPNSSMPSIYTHITEKEVDDNRRALITGEEISKPVEKSKNLPIKCIRCGEENYFDNTYCCRCFLPLKREIVDRDVNLLDMLRTRFLEFEGLNVEETLRKYQHFKLWTRDMEKMLTCFNGSNEVTNDVVQRALNLNTDECLQLLGYLVAAKMIDLDDDKVILRDKNRYEQFLSMHKHYTEPSF